MPFSTTRKRKETTGKSLNGAAVAVAVAVVVVVAAAAAVAAVGAAADDGAAEWPSSLDGDGTWLVRSASGKDYWPVG